MFYWNKSLVFQVCHFGRGNGVAGSMDVNIRIVFWQLQAVRARKPRNRDSRRPQGLCGECNSRWGSDGDAARSDSDYRHAEGGGERPATARRRTRPTTDIAEAHRWAAPCVRWLAARVAK